MGTGLPPESGRGEAASAARPISWRLGGSACCVRSTEAHTPSGNLQVSVAGANLEQTV